MATVGDKAEVVGLSLVHKLLDAVLDLDDVGALKVHARKLDGARRGMETFGNSLTASIELLEDNIKQGKPLVESLTADVDQLLDDDNPDNDYQANVLAEQLVSAKKNLKADEEKLVEKSAQSEATEEAIQLLTNQYNEVVERVEELEETAEETKAMKKGAKAMDQVARAVGDLPDVDSVGNKIVRKNAEAKAAFNRSLGRTADSIGSDQTSAEAAAYLSRRREELAAEKDKS